MNWGWAVALGVVLWVWATWNVAAYQRRRLQERREAELRRKVWPSGPDTASPGEGRGK